jgi:hypothetical protein
MKDAVCLTLLMPTNERTPNSRRIAGTDESQEVVISSGICRDRRRGWEGPCCRLPGFSHNTKAIKLLATGIKYHGDKEFEWESTKAPA